MTGSGTSSPSWARASAGGLILVASLLAACTRQGQHSARLSVAPEPMRVAAPSRDERVAYGRWDIGLHFRLCHIRHLAGIDFLGDGTRGRAWTGAPVVTHEPCSAVSDEPRVVAADFTGDGLADDWSGPLEYCADCR